MLSEQLRVEIQRNIAASLAEDIGTGNLTARLIASFARPSFSLVDQTEL